MKKVLQALCGFYPTDLRPSPPGAPEGAHGAGYTYERAQCAWHRATPDEAAWAVQLFNTYAGRCLGTLRAMARAGPQGERPGAPVDVHELRLVLMQLRALVRGACGLLPRLCGGAEAPATATEAPLPVADAAPPVTDVPLLVPVPDWASDPECARAAAALDITRGDIVRALEAVLFVKDGVALSLAATALYAVAVAPGPIDKFKFTALHAGLVSVKSSYARHGPGGPRYARLYVARAAHLHHCRLHLGGEACRVAAAGPGGGGPGDAVPAEHRPVLRTVTRLCLSEFRLASAAAQFVFGTWLDCLPRAAARAAIAGVMARLLPPEGPRALDQDVFEGAVGVLSIPLVMRLVTESWPLLTQFMRLMLQLQSAVCGRGSQQVGGGGKERVGSTPLPLPSPHPPPARGKFLGHLWDTHPLVSTPPRRYL